MFNFKYIIIISTLLGACIGGYYHVKTGNYIMTGLGAVLGSVAGRSLAKISNKKEMQTDNNLIDINKHIIISTIFTVAGVVAYMYRHKISVLISTLFFLIWTIILFIKKYER